MSGATYDANRLLADPVVQVGVMREETFCLLVAMYEMAGQHQTFAASWMDLSFAAERVYNGQKIGLIGPTLLHHRFARHWRNRLSADLAQLEAAGWIGVTRQRGAANRYRIFRKLEARS